MGEIISREKLFCGFFLGNDSVCERGLDEIDVPIDFFGMRSILFWFHKINDLI
jgi:hypothetical protein